MRVQHFNFDTPVFIYLQFQPSLS